MSVLEYREEKVGIPTSFAERLFSGCCLSYTEENENVRVLGGKGEKYWDDLQKDCAWWVLLSLDLQGRVVL